METSESFRAIESALASGGLSPHQLDLAMSHLVAMTRRLKRLESYLSDSQGLSYQAAQDLRGNAGATGATVAGRPRRRMPAADSHVTRAGTIDDMPTMATPTPWPVRQARRR